MAVGLQNFQLKTLYNLPTYTDNIPNIAMKKRLLLLAILPLSLHAADVPPDVKPELQVNTAEPQQPEAHNIPAEQTNRPSEKIINVDADTLLVNTELLARAMYSAVVAHNIPGIKAVLPIYEQWPEHDRAMARYAKGLLAQSEGRAAEAIGHYRRFIAEQPDASAVRWQLATALFEDKQNEAAADQFDKLQTESLPPALQERIETYRKALRERDSWQFNAGLNITREQNINQAPSQRRLGNHLSDEQCRAMRLAYPDDDCFRGWTFPEPIDATAVHYQIGAEKKMVAAPRLLCHGRRRPLRQNLPQTHQLQRPYHTLLGRPRLCRPAQRYRHYPVPRTPLLRQRPLHLHQRRTPPLQPLVATQAANSQRI